MMPPCVARHEIFFPEGYLGRREPGQTVETDPLPDYHSATAMEARALCAGCPLLEECREAALDMRLEYGIIAGMDPDEVMREVAKNALQERGLR